MANAGTETKNVMIPWAAKVQVKPSAACQGAMKNYHREIMSVILLPSVLRSQGEASHTGLAKADKLINTA